jgi:integrase
MALHRFTDPWIRSCPQPASGRLEFADELCPGLHLRITSRGKKTFSAMVRVNGRLQRRTIGRYPAVSLGVARTRTREILGLASEGVDARQPAATAEMTLTYGELVDLYNERHLEPNTRSAKLIRGNLRHRTLRHLFTRPVAGITRRELIEALDAIVANGTRQAALNIYRNLKMLFHWAWKRDLIAENPCDRIPPPAKGVERDRVLNDSEIVALWNAAENLNPPFRQFVRLLMLTGQRRSEVAKLRWADIAGDTWVIPREIVKKDRPHAVPLTRLAQEVLSELPRFVGGDYAITTCAGQKPSCGFSKMKAELERLTAIPPFTLHDIRRTVRSKLAELGISREVARKVVNHEDGKVDRIYNRHEYLAEKREALERWESKLKALVSASRLARKNARALSPR